MLNVTRRWCQQINVMSGPWSKNNFFSFFVLTCISFSWTVLHRGPVSRFQDLSKGGIVHIFMCLHYNQEQDHLSWPGKISDQAMNPGALLHSRSATAILLLVHAPFGQLICIIQIQTAAVLKCVQSTNLFCFRNFIFALFCRVGKISQMTPDFAI